MTWTYSGDPSASDLDAVRFAIGDTVSADPLLTDEEIEFLLAATSATVASASVAAARNLAARFARDVDRQVGNLRISASQRAASFRALAVQLEADRVAALGTGVPYAGGISAADKDTRYDNDDRVHGSFFRSSEDWRPPGPTLYGAR
ncbi:MAG: hypothetical protein AB7N65_17695 [Vicinamibacterales bacterium]